MKRFIWTFTLRGYNYTLHNTAPHKLKALSSLSCVLAPGFFLVIPSPAVFCLSAVSQYMPSSVIPCSVLLLSCLVDESSLVCKSSSNPLKVALCVPSRGHLVEQLIFPAVMQTTLVAARTKVYLAVDWQWTLLSRKRLNSSVT
jgi:hypothetical protein